MHHLGQTLKTKTFALILIAVMAVSGGVWTHLSQAAPGQIYVSPATTSSIQNGASFSVSIRINPGGPVDSVDVTLGYDQAKVQFVSVDSSGSNFPASVTENGGSGSVHIVRFIGGGSTVNTDALISRVNFKSLSGSGSTSLSLAGSNAAYTGAYTNPSLVNGTVNFTTPATPTPTPTSPTPTTPAPSTSTRSTPHNSTSRNTPAPTTTPTPTAPSSPSTATTTPPACNVAISSVSFSTAVAHVTCNPAARVFIKFGNEGKLIESTQPTANAVTETDIQLSGVTIKPGSSVSFAVVAINNSGEQIETAAQAFDTKGYSIKIKVLGKDKQPLANRQFVFRSTPLSAKSDKSGNLSFTDVSPGQHSLELTGIKTKQVQNISVLDNVQTAADGNQTAAVQNFSLIYSGVRGGSIWLWLGFGLFLLITLALAIGWLFFHPRGPKWSNKLPRKKSQLITPGGQMSVINQPSEPFVKPVIAPRPMTNQSNIVKPTITNPAAPAAPITPVNKPTGHPSIMLNSNRRIIKQAPIIDPTQPHPSSSSGDTSDSEKDGLFSG